MTTLLTTAPEDTNDPTKAGASATTSGASGTLLTQGAGTNPFPTSLTNGVAGNGLQTGAYANYNVNEGGIQGDANTVTGYAAWDPAHMNRGDLEGLYDASGKFTGTEEMRGDSFDIGEFAKGLAFVGAFALGANALFGGTGAAADGVAQGATYTSPGEMDAGLAEQTAGGGGVTNGTALTGEYTSPGEVDQQLAEQTMGSEGNYMSPGQADQDLATQTAGEGGVNGPPDASDANYRNGSDIQSDIATETGTAPPGSVNEGVTTEVPGANWAPATPTGPLDWIKDVFGGGGGGAGAGAGAGSVAGSIIPAAVSTLLTELIAPKAPTTGTPPPYTPTQPQVGAGDYASAFAQGGASGSMQGVAGTLLTAKDTFGYGKSMLG